jgi:hypothetical protein
MMRKLMICMTGAAMLLLVPLLSQAAPYRADAAPAAHKSVEQARLVRRCHIGRAWHDGPHGRHLVRHRACHMVEIR